MPQALVGLIGVIIPGLTTAAGGLTLLGSVLSAGIGLGISYGLNRVLGGQQQPTPEDVSTVVQASTTVRTRHCGRVRVGGSRVFIETENGNLHQIIAFGQGEFDAIEGYYIDDGVFTLGPAAGTTGTTGWVQESPHNGRSVYIETRLGTATQTAFSTLVSRFPSIWTNDHRLAAISCAHIIQHAVKAEDFGSVYPNRIAEVQVLARGAKVLDTRTGVTAWSTNLPLCLRDYLTHPDGARIPAEMINVASINAAATIADELVALKAGGNIPRYHGSLSYAFNEEPIAVINRFLAAMDGRLFLGSDGKITLTVGQWVEPTVTISDDDDADVVLEYSVKDGAGPFASFDEIVV